MVMSYIFLSFLSVSVLSAVLTGTGPALSPALLQGAQAGFTLVLSLAGSICLWSGVIRLLEEAGVTPFLSRMLKPLLGRLFPSTLKNPALSAALSGNVCANLLGLGNGATPPGIQAAKLLVDSRRPERAGDELCRLIVLNTASIQLIPSTVAALRAACGCSRPMDILPCVWVTSACSAGVGLAAAWILGKLWKK